MAERADGAPSAAEVAIAIRMVAIVQHSYRV